MGVLNIKPFSIRLVERPAQGQQVLGGHNSANNCVPDSLLVCYESITGIWPCSPQDLTSMVYGPNYVGGETFQAIVNKMKQRSDLFPQLPDIEVHDFGSHVDPVIIGNYGVLRFPMATSFHCDTNGVIRLYPTGILHASCPVSFDGSVMKVWNVEGYEQSFTLADFYKAYTGALVIFKQPVLSNRPDYTIEDDMQVIGPTNTHSYIPGVYTGKPGNYTQRDQYLAIWHDSDFGPSVSLDVLFVPQAGPPLQGHQTVSLTASQQVTLRVPDNFNGAIVIKHMGGDKYCAALKTEYL